MPWQKIDLETWAEELGINLEELRQKDRLIEQIVETRSALKLTQRQLADLVGVSQPRIAQIENRVKIGTVTFDVLLNILRVLGYEIHITACRVHPPAATPSH